MNIDEAIEIVNDLKKITQSFKVNCNLQDYEVPDAIEKIINEYNNLKQIEEAHRIENGKLRKGGNGMGTITVLGLENCNEALKTIGQNIIDRSDDITKDLKGVSKIIIHAELNPAEIASFDITKEYIAGFEDCKERKN